MTITDRITDALSLVLANSSLPGSPVITSTIETDLNTQESVRVIVSTTSSELRQLLLPGIYDVTGEVTIYTTIDEQTGSEDRQAEYRALCAAVESVIGKKYDMPVELVSFDSALTVYSWNLTGQNSFMQSRAMGAKYSWTCFARQGNHNPN